MTKQVLMLVALVLGSSLSLASLLPSLRGKTPSPTYGPIYSGATTFNDLHSVSQPLTWTKAGELAFPKYQNESNLFFTCQVTFTNNEPGPYGTMFKLKFRTLAGEYISESPFTGQVSAYANAYQNCHLSDTILDSRVMNHPPAGDYVAELWALTGGGTLNVVPFATNIAVLEAPFFITPQ